MRNLEKRKSDKAEEVQTEADFVKEQAMQQYEKALLSDTLSCEELNEINWNKRKAIITHAYNHSAFYKRFYDEHDRHADGAAVPVPRYHSLYHALNKAPHENDRK